MPERLMALFMLIVGGVGSAYMLTRLDSESQRLLQLDTLWYPRKKRETDESELRKIRRNIRILYSAFLVTSFVTVIYVIFGR